MEAKRHNRFRWLKALLVALSAAALTMCALAVWPRVEKIAGGVLLSPSSPSSPSLAGSDSPSPGAGEGAAVNVDVEDRLAEEGWLRVSADSGTVLSYAVVPGMEEPSFSEINWKETGRSLHVTDTIRPKRDCVIAVRAERNGRSDYRSFTFDYGVFIEKLLRFPSEGDGSVIRDVIYSFTGEQPLTISYDNMIEDRCSSLEKDYVNLEILRERLNGAESIHVDSISSYSRKSPVEEVLDRQYPALEFLGLKGSV